MEKLTEKQFLLIINGPSCGGKSTTSDLFLEQFEEIFNAKSDHIKWLLSGYFASKHRDIIHEITKAMIERALDNGVSVLKEGAIFQPEKLVEIADDRKIPCYIVNVSAPWEVLAKRFESRIEAKKKGARISNTSHDRFKEIYEMYLDSKMKTDLEFDSSEKSPEEIVREIVSYIRANI